MKIFWWTPRFNVFIENIFVVTSLLIEQNFERAPMQRNTCSSGGFPCKKRTIGIRTIERTKTTMTIGICWKPGRIEEWPWRAPSRRHQMQQSPDVQQLETRKRSKALATSLVARFDMRAVPYSTSFGVSPSRALTATWNKTWWNWSHSQELKKPPWLWPWCWRGGCHPQVRPIQRCRATIQRRNQFQRGCRTIEQPVKRMTTTTTTLRGFDNDEDKKDDLVHLFLLGDWQTVDLVCVVHDEMIFPGDLDPQLLGFRKN